MSNVFAEVDEAIKQERIEKIWKEHGGLIIGCIAALILGTAANAGYSAWKTKESQSQTSLLIHSMENADDSANELNDISSELNSGLRSLAAMKSASISLKNGDIEDAVAQYKSISADDNLELTFRQQAEYLSISLDTKLSTEDKITALMKIAANEQNSWRFHAHLDLATLKANLTNQIPEARRHLSLILEDDNALPGLKKKAQSVDIVYALKEKI